MNLKVGVVQGDKPISGSPSVASGGPLQHVNGVPVSHQHPFTPEVGFHLHQLIHLQQEKKSSVDFPSTEVPSQVYVYKNTSKVTGSEQCQCIQQDPNALTH